MQIAGDVNCPTCNKPHKAIMELPDSLLPKPEVKVEAIAPDYIPKMKCGNAYCDHDGGHHNRDYKRRPKARCENCGQFHPEKQTKFKTEKCLWCGSTDLEDLDEEDLNDLGIPEPKGHTHSHGGDHD